MYRSFLAFALVATASSERSFGAETLAGDFVDASDAYKRREVALSTAHRRSTREVALEAARKVVEAEVVARSADACAQGVTVDARGIRTRSTSARRNRVPDMLPRALK